MEASMKPLKLFIIGIMAENMKMRLYTLTLLHSKDQTKLFTILAFFSA